ncbi:MAG: hypothetical protein UIM25_06950, partial [Bacteroidales bacterium]|nr:hypothetical protein [Bacteroidales bacterium]
TNNLCNCNGRIPCYSLFDGDIMNRAERLKKEFKEKLEEFGSPECNKTQRRKMLKQLRDLEQEMDKLYGVK